MTRFTSPGRSAARAHPEPTINGQRQALAHTRAGGLWVALAAFALVLLLLLIFILQNGQQSDVFFLGAHGQLPMGVALLLAAVFGVLLVTAPATLRIVQLRVLARHHTPVAAGPAGPEAGRTDSADGPGS